MKASPKELLLRSTFAIVRALAKLLLKEGVSYAMFAEIARGAFVDAAKESEIEGRKLSDSRISIITGLSRKEVRRLKDKKAEDYEEDDLRHNRAVRIITAWNREKKYCTKKRAPRVLPLDGASPSLTELVTEYGRGVPVRAVVDELQRVGAIVESKPGYWRLENPAYIPKYSDATIMKILGADVPLLIDTIQFNANAEANEKRFQRKVCYDNVPRKHVKSFKHIAERESFALLKKLDRWLSDHEPDSDTCPVDAKERTRTGVSVFFFEEPYDKERYSNDK